VQVKRQIAQYNLEGIVEELNAENHSFAWEVIMKSRCLVVTLVLMIASLGIAQTADQLSIQRVMQSFVAASEKQDARAYASLFGPDSLWDGPLGHNAIGSANIRKPAEFMFSCFGPLTTMEWQVRQLTPDVTVVDLYQKMNTRLEDLHSVPESPPIIPGSAEPLHRVAVRTTFIFQKRKDQWTIVAARVADLRVRKDRSMTAMKTADERP
jgi:uncharacterized protein (TIGR02246 family)